MFKKNDTMDNMEQFPLRDVTCDLTETINESVTSVTTTPISPNSIQGWSCDLTESIPVSLQHQLVPSSGNDSYAIP